jgi:hypothetical protein
MLVDGLQLGSDVSFSDILEVGRLFCFHFGTTFCRKTSSSNVNLVFVESVIPMEFGILPKQ